MKKCIVFITCSMIHLSFSWQDMNIKKFFGSAKEFEIQIPVTYNHDLSIDQFMDRAKNRKNYFCNLNLTSENFVHTTDWLKPEKTYTVKIFPVLKPTTTKNCLDFLTKENNLLVGTQGLLLIQSLKPGEFPLNKRVVSFDKKSACWQEFPGMYRVPFACHSSNNNDAWYFDFNSFDLDWGNECCLLVVYEKEEK